MIWLLWIPLLFLPCFAFSDEVPDGFVINDRAAGYFEDAEGLTAQELMRSRESLFSWKSVLPRSLGFRSHPVWMLYEHQHTGKDELFYFEHAFAFTSRFDLYHFDADHNLISHSRSGASYPFTDRVYPSRFNIAQSSLRPGVNYLLFRFQSANPLITETSMWTQSGYFNHVTRESLYINVCIGGVLLISFVNFFVYLTSREKTHLFYAAFSFIQVFDAATLQGVPVLFDFMNGHEAWLFENGLYVILSLIVVTGSFFCASFLNMQSYMPFLSKTLTLLRWLAYIGTVCHFFINSTFLMVYTLSVLTMACIVVFIAALQACYRRYKPAYVFTAAWTLLIVSSVQIILEYLGILDYSSFTLKLHLFGIVVDGGILSLALGYRFAEFQRKQEEETVKKNHYFNQMEKVFHPHQLAMMQNGRHLEDTMPVGMAEACVIAFDVVNSSGIGHVQNHEFFEAVMKRCQDIMNASYNPDTLSSNAFRIKEMGDGFLCAVGFPFKNPSACSLESQAYRVALKFVEAFKEEVLEHFGHSDFHCGIGIAKGTVVGYFPRSGTKDYDLFGDGIIHATRYESMRKELFKGVIATDIVILQTRVFEGLTGQEQQQFVTLDLEEKKIVVKDDKDAKKIHYRSLQNKLAECA